MWGQWPGEDIGWLSSCGTAETVPNDTLLEVPHLLPCTLHAFEACGLAHIISQADKLVMSS